MQINHILLVTKPTFQNLLLPDFVKHLKHNDGVVFRLCSQKLAETQRLTKRNVVTTLICDLMTSSPIMLQSALVQYAPFS